MNEERSEVEHRQLLFEAVSRFEHAAIRPLYLLNGGAAVAAIAFLGKNTDAATAIVTPMKWWIAGLLFAAAVTACGYFSQFMFYKAHGRHMKGTAIDAIDTSERALRVRVLAYIFGTDTGERAQRVRVLAYIFGAVSLISFAVGSVLAVDSLANLPT